MKIKTVENEIDLKRLFNFFSKTFYIEATNNNEHYYNMSDRYKEMQEQYTIDRDMLMYIEVNDNIIAGIVGKNMNTLNKSITMGILAVTMSERGKGFAKLLIEEFENRCIKKGISHIKLCSRFRAALLYKKLNYNFTLMVQVFDFTTTKDIRKNNKYNFKEKDCYQGDTYGFIIYYVDDVREEYINYFEDNIDTAHAQYLFEKDLL